MARQNRQNQSAREDAIAVRREYVARLSAAGMSSREIEAKLAKLKPPIVADHSTICNDLNELRPLLLEAVNTDPVNHLAREFAELQEAKRRAWRRSDLRVWTRLMNLEMRLLGTMAPARFNIDYGMFSDEQLRRLGQGGNPIAMLSEVVTEMREHRRLEQEERDRLVEAAGQELERRRALRAQGEKQS